MKRIPIAVPVVFAALLAVAASSPVAAATPATPPVGQLHGTMTV